MLKLSYNSQLELWVVTEDTIVELDGFSILIKKGFKTDLASIPRIFWSIYPPFGKYQDAAICHDWLLDNTDLPKRTIDLLFYKKMKSDGVGIFNRFIFYSFVNIVPKKRK